MTDPDATKMIGNLVAAVNAVMTAVHSIPRDGKNQFHGYSYTTEAAYLAELQPHLAANGLALFPVLVDVTEADGPTSKAGKAQRLTSTKTTYMLAHKDGGAIEVIATGCGIDGEDKGLYKARTGGLKYLLKDLFLVASGDFDPERDATEPATKPKKETAAEKQARQSEHHKTWDANRKWFMGRLSELGYTYDGIKDHVAAKSKTGQRPSQMDRSGLEALLTWLASDAGRTQMVELGVEASRKREPGSEG